MKEWVFITNHALVLLYIMQNPQSTTRDIASAVSITERTVHRILADLEREDYITHIRTGRGNIYEIYLNHKLKHELTMDSTVRDLFNFIGDRNKRKRREGRKKNQGNI